jgi:hypothetical protein
LEDNGITPRPRGVRKRTHCLGGFILISRKKVVQALVSKAVKEPFAVMKSKYKFPAPINISPKYQIAYI